MLCVTVHMHTETDSIIFGLTESSLFGLDTLTVITFLICIIEKRQYL